jgi:hypothetical protein
MTRAGGRIRVPLACGAFATKEETRHLSSDQSSARPGFNYDVAISFLAGDEGTAIELESELEAAIPAERIFYYADRQGSLVGKEAIEAFRTTFMVDTRNVVVLYRKGWGESGFTRVEEDAIRDRYLRSDGRFLQIVSLAPSESPAPAWYPETRVYLDLPRFGVEKVAGAIIQTVAERGAEVREETYLELAVRLAREQATEQTLRDLLMRQGVQMAGANVRQLFGELRAGAAAVTETGLGLMEFEEMTDRCVVRLANAAFLIVFPMPQVNVTDHGVHIKISRYDGPLSFRQPVYSTIPREREALTMFFQVGEGEVWHWTQLGSGRRLATTVLADWILKNLLRLARGDGLPFRDWRVL